MTQYEAFRAIYEHAEAGTPIPDDLLQLAESHGLRVDAVVDTVASLQTAAGENDFDE